MWAIIRKEWDQLSVYFLMAVFGIYSTINPILSVSRSVPAWVEILFGAEFLAGGVLLFIGTFTGSVRVKKIGNIILFLGLLVISALIILASQANAWRSIAYALLILGFAMQFIVGFRRAYIIRIQKEEILELVEQATSDAEARDGSV